MLDFCSPKCAAQNVKRVVGQLNVRIEAERKAFEKTMGERVPGIPVLSPPQLPAFSSVQEIRAQIHTRGDVKAMGRSWTPPGDDRD